MELQQLKGCIVMKVNYYFNIVFDIGEKYSLSHEGVLTILNGGIIVDGDLSGGA